MDKTLLVLGAGADQIPGILKAKEMGIYSIALDGNSNAPGKKYADEFYKVSIKHFEQIERFVKERLTKKVDGIIAFGIDIASIVAKTADMLGVNYTVSYESAKLSEDKFLSKEFMRKNDIAIPSYKLANNISDLYDFVEKFDLPVVVKPVDNSAARGVSYIDDINNLKKYYSYALEFSKQKKVQVEKFLNGHQISTESFIINGKIYNIGFADRNYDNMHKFLPNIIENGGDMPSVHMKDEHKQQLANYLEVISKKLNIKNGVIKGDIVIHDGKLYIIEFALRLSGGNFSTIEIPENTGVDFLKVAIKLHLGMQICEGELRQTKNEYISMRYKFAEDVSKGIVREINLPKNFKNIVAKKFYIQKGDQIKDATTNHLNRLGFVIAKGESRDEAMNTAQNFLDSVEIIVE